MPLLGLLSSLEYRLPLVIGAYLGVACHLVGVPLAPFTGGWTPAATGECKL